MSKTDRLLQLLKLIRSDQSITVRQMSRACKVSHRTIYRYLNTLADLDLVAPSGSGLTRHGLSACLDVDDLQLVLFCLNANPLVCHRYFANRLRSIKKQMITACDDSLSPDDSCLFRIELAHDNVGHSDQSEFLEQFVRARNACRSLRLCFRSAAVPLTCKPVAVVLRQSGIGLIVDEGEKTDEVDLGEVESISLGPVRRKKKKN